MLPSAHSAEPREHLIVFSRFPRPGRSKTRMIPVLREDGAALLQRDMTLHALSNVAELLDRRNLTVEVHFTGGSALQMKDTFGPQWTYVEQTAGDLGARMSAAIRRAFDRGAATVAVMGTDCPDLGPEAIAGAFDRMSTDDVVFVPATDGGYVLVATRRPAPEVFKEIPWGTEDVLRASIDAAGRGGLTVGLVDPLPDVDTPRDLGVWRRADEARRNQAISPQISIIVPVLNESANLAETLSSAQTGRGIELIVVDGKSRDDSVQKAQACGAAVLQSDSGRGIQMNSGATRASGDVLLFLHADTLLPPGYDRAIRRAMRRPAIVGGAFRLHLDAPGTWFRIIESAVDLRSRIGRRPYGDQALFVARQAFEQIGGYPDQPIMEDCELVRSLRRRGELVMLDLPVRTSARRWLDNGVWRTTLRHQLYLAAHALGVSPARIASWRHKQRAPSTEMPAG